MEKLLVNADGWYCKLVNGNTGVESILCNGCKMIDVEVLGYTKLTEKKKSFVVDDLKKYYPVGKVVRSNERNFKEYPDFIGVWCGEWVKSQGDRRC